MTHTYAHPLTVAEVPVIYSYESISFCEGGWIDSLTSGASRPNLLVSCRDVGLQAVVRRLANLCQSPFLVYEAAGRLQLPQQGVRTLLTYDVAALTLAEQIELYDWITLRRPETQIISVTSRPLYTLVADGRFLEGLFYRLNVVHLSATSGTMGEVDCGE